MRVTGRKEIKSWLDNLHLTENGELYFGDKDFIVKAFSKDSLEEASGKLKTILEENKDVLIELCEETVSSGYPSDEFIAKAFHKSIIDFILLLFYEKYND